jgi:cytochrome c biogenesis protein CcmG, thiol:disulfide interchange protein DsbE
MTRASIVLMAALAVAVAACGTDRTAAAPAAPGAVGTEVPAYGALNMAGDSVDLASYRGDVVLLNVWATWCIPCRREVPELQALHQEYESRGLRVLGVSVDGGEAASDIAAFVKDFGMTYTVLRDPAERIMTVFRIQGVPASYLIDRQGVVKWRTIGPFTAKDAGLQAALSATL